MAKCVENTVAPAPSRILTKTLGGSTVVTKLYGEVSPERLAKEQAELTHRVDQFQPLPVRVPRSRPRMDDYFPGATEFLD